MIISILQPSYLPWLGFFDLMLRSNLFVYHDNIAFDKSWRNRNRIRTANGSSWLTVPIKGRARASTLLTDIQIDNSRDWARRHWNLVREAYQKSPYFRKYGPELEEILRGRKWDYLFELNYATTQHLLLCLGMSPRIRYASNLPLGDSKKNERIIRICKCLEADTWLANSACRAYVEPQMYMREKIRVAYQDYIHPEYPQVYSPFISHLSVIDLLFNCGPKSLEVIQGRKYGIRKRGEESAKA